MASSSEETLRRFVFERVLNQDTRTKVVNVLGRIGLQPAIVIAEKTAFPTDLAVLETFSQPCHLTTLSLIERNDIYHWFLASQTSGELPQNAEVKLTLIFPATETHIRKYSQQHLKMVTETSEVYRDHVLPYVNERRAGGGLNWVYNVLEKKRESESIIVEDTDEKLGYMLLPDLKWDRHTMSSLYTIALVLDRGLTSIRDLKKKHVGWLRTLQEKILEGICSTYSGIQKDQIKLYVHYPPSYYHFHIHAAAITHDGGMGQATGRAILLQNVISQLESMNGGDEAGFADVALTYILGEESELWQTVFSRLQTYSSA